MSFLCLFPQAQTELLTAPRGLKNTVEKTSSFLYMRLYKHVHTHLGAVIQTYANIVHCILTVKMCRLFVCKVTPGEVKQCLKTGKSA